MSDIIQLLPDHVANQIAAGEVVQRPASVVKELLENAIDAGAEKIELIVREAGKNLIQVVDDGKGMSETDARMAFERHATSKIKSTEDIFKIVTKGFRGEALASIAAVSQVDLKTKRAEDPLGTNIYIEGGGLQFQEAVQTAGGSNFQVKNLFYNVPARRKFLKSNNIEFRHIIDEFQRVALAHEQIEFHLFHNDEPIFRLRKGGQLQRIVDIFGRKLQPLLIPISEDLDWVKLSGFVGKPEGAKKVRGEQFLFVNNRFFKSPYLNKAVQDAFEGLLMPNYIPAFFLFLEIDPDKIDINIHPQKTEVKFENENLIFALIRSTIKRSLGIYNVAPSLDFDRGTQMDDFFKTQKSPYSPGIKAPDVSVNRDFNPFKEEISESGNVDIAHMYQQNIPAEPSKINLFEEEDFDEDLMRLPNGYWVLNKEGKTLILDMGRIHKTVVRSKKAHAKPSNKSQPLLFSVEYLMNEIEKNKFRSIKKYLPGLGFEIQIAENMLRVDAVPEGLRESQVHDFLAKLFEILEYKSEEDFLNFYNNQWLEMKTKSRFDFIYKHDVEELLKEFNEIGFPQYTATGNKCFVELALDEIKNKFY